MTKSPFLYEYFFNNIYTLFAPVNKKNRLTWCKFAWFENLPEISICCNHFFDGRFYNSFCCCSKAGYCRSQYSPTANHAGNYEGLGP